MAKRTFWDMLPESDQQELTTPVVLKPGRRYAHIVAPMDLTEAEAERICAVVRALAFPNATEN